MDWCPQPGILQEAAELFRSASRPEADVQARVREGVEQLKRSPEGPQYLAFLLVEGHSESIEVRQLAGLLLKNMVGPGLAPEALEYIKKLLLKALYDSNDVIRRTGGLVITSIVNNLGCDAFGDALASISQLIQQSQNIEIARTALDVWKQIAEDELEHRYDLAAQTQGALEKSQFAQLSGQQFIPLLLRLAASDVSPVLREQSLSILQIYNARQCFAFSEFAVSYFDQFWALLGQVATDPSPKVKAVVIQAMLTVAEYNIDPVIAHSGPVFDLMLRGCADPNYEVRLAATGFWPAILKEDNTLGLVESYLPRLVPILIEQMVYTEADYQQVDAAQIEDDNAAVPDRASQMEPRFHQSRQLENGECDDDDDDEDEDERKAWGDKWTVRKGAALALDHLGLAFHEKLLPHCLPLIERRLQSANWEERESGVLALGAISKGCLRSLDQFVPNVLALLIRLSEDSKPLLRSICCWCLNRFAPWLCASENVNTYLEPVLVALMQRMLDRNKSVQEAAVSAFAGLEEWARSELVPYLPQIFETLARAFETYQARNMLILYDAISTLAQAVGDAFIQAHPAHHSQRLLNPFFAKWVAMNPDDFQIAAICECMGSVAQALGKEVLPMAPALTQKCVSILQVHVSRDERPSNDHDDAPPRLPRESQDVLEACLDLLSYLSETLLDSYMPIVKQHNFIPIVERCCVDPKFTHSMAVLQSAFALIGDLGLFCLPLLEPHLPNVIPALANGLSATVAVCSNASWALGELVLKVDPLTMDPYAEYIMTRLTHHVAQHLGNISLRQNACITIGRFAAKLPDRVSPLLSEIIAPWCELMARYRNEGEKLKSFKGLCVALTRSPTVAREQVAPLLHFVVSFVRDETVPRPPDAPPSQPESAVLRQMLSNIDPMLVEVVIWLRDQSADAFSEKVRVLGDTDRTILMQLLS